MRWIPFDLRRAHPEIVIPRSLLVVLVAWSATLVGACTEGGEDESAPKAPSKVYVEITRVEPEQLRHEVALTGQLNADSAVTIRPEVDGVVASVEFEEGKRVKKGALLFRMRSAEAEARLALEKADLALAQDVFDRTQRLNLRDVSAVSQLSEATAKLDEAKARVQLAQVELDRTRIRAPFEGVTGIRNVDVGDRVEEGDPMVGLAAIDRLQLVFTVPSMAFSLGRVGATINARVFSYPGERFPGEVFFVSPTVDPATRRMILKALVPNADHRLKPGMFANVDIEVAVREGALVVPESALVYDRSGTYLWRVLEGEKAEKVPVQIGLRQEGRVEIVSGIAAGDVIVSVGVHKVTSDKVLVDVNEDATSHAARPTSRHVSTKERGEEG